MSLLTRQQIIEADDCKSQVVEVPEWGGSVAVRVLSVAERLKFESVFERDRKKVVPVLLALTLEGDDGQLLFSEDDIAQLEAKNAVVVMRIFDHAKELNKLTKEDVQNLEKKSQASQAESSPTA